MSKRLGYLLLLLPAMIILLGVFLIPMLFILLLSLEGAEGQFSWSNYLMFFQDTYYLEILGRTISLSLYTVACTLLLAYPVAMFMART
ncbi:MAG TPA: ABC transporter permease, partial [Brevibacillus sp.]|nr:ABC transporter permease [Brevibacillus sp.]